jgi:hypothetical protein
VAVKPFQRQPAVLHEPADEVQAHATQVKNMISQTSAAITQYGQLATGRLLNNFVRAGYEGLSGVSHDEVSPEQPET